MDEKLDYNQEMFRKLGFGNYFDEAYLQGKADRVAQISFVPGTLPFNGAKLEVLPTVIYRPEYGEEFYLIKGYQATLKTENKPDVSQFLQVYKSIGFDVDQAYALLNGRAVKHLQGYKDDIPQFSYSQINFERVTENGNYSLRRRAADDDALFQVLGKMGIIAQQEEKERIFQRLQQGARISVNIRNGEDSKKMFIQAATRTRGMGIDLMDLTGQLVKQFPDRLARPLQPLRTLEGGQELNPLAAQIAAGAGNPEGSRLRPS